MSNHKKARLHLSHPDGLTPCGIRTVNLWRGVLTTQPEAVTCGNCRRLAEQAREAAS